ncbi:TetR/AcrR family transcriptional regulator [Cronobacter sakazakii]|nr:TetR/AcrR family transcriptional regulator [Cronobacter sakazakii]EMC4237083.1 TetR/AcrR family transcriptional regulator [Cronobacter sakazakii]EMC4245643.1 TetR/AcrR family transcriptional regulator [Cronobacter sakazakii]EMC4250092.1 TetR/AcrR family transcriptional regulator [Cronobacter sakazakii]EMC4258470.1 TetR/AcrR family transcriptional regulator [Cronobacter sakazakii]
MSVARPRSEDKRMAILEAATEAIAEAGLGASTALIARKAGVAEGTIFRYFASKDDLYNARYVHLKQDFCRSMIGKLDSKNDHKENIRYVWNSFIDWGLTKPEANLAARKLEVSSRITDESKKLVTDIYPELHELCEKCILPLFRSSEFRAFGDEIFFALAQTTMDFATREPARSDEFKAVGFDTLWRAMCDNQQA